jgi:hypothetical protein
MNDIFRTVRELLQSNKCVLMGNAVNNEGELYDDSVENLTAILAMQDSHKDLLAALTDAYQYMMDYKKCQNQGLLDDMQAAITKAKGN